MATKLAGILGVNPARLYEEGAGAGSVLKK
jgi:hypothetical protein